MSQAAAQYHPALFRNVPPKDIFHLFENNGRPNAKKVVELLNYKKEDVAVASDLSISSIRYDAKMPEVLLGRIKEWATAINLVGSFFGDQHKTMLWFQMPNPLLGNMSPRDMIRVGRFNKLLKFIQTALDENKR